MLQYGARPERAPPYADALPDLAGPGRRALRLANVVYFITGSRQSRESSFWAPNNVFSRQFVPKPGHRVLVNGDFCRKLVSAKVRRLLVIGIFRTRLIAYTHRETGVFAEISSQVSTAPENVYHSIAIK